MTELAAVRFAVGPIGLGYHRVFLQVDCGMTSDVRGFRGAVGSPSALLPLLQ